MNSIFQMTVNALAPRKFTTFDLMTFTTANVHIHVCVCVYVCAYTRIHIYILL